MNDALTASQEELIVTGAMEDMDGVRKEMGNGFEGLDGAFGAAGEIYDDGVSAHGSNRAG